MDSGAESYRFVTPGNEFREVTDTITITDLEITWN